MHLMIVNFSLEEMSEADYLELCDQLASTFADIPGLISKVWLANTDTNTYGGVYTWQNVQAMDDFKASDLFNTVATHPNFANITARDFGVVDGPTQVTRGEVEAVA